MAWAALYDPLLTGQDTHRFHLLGPKLDGFLRSHTHGYYPFMDIENDKIQAEATTAQNDQGGEVGDADIDMEEMDEFPSGHTPGWSDPEGYANDQIEQLLVLMKGRGILRKSVLVTVGVRRVCVIKADGRI
jgi:hypothetical protein